MKFVTLNILILLIALGNCHILRSGESKIEEKVRYDDYSVFKLFINSEKQLDFIEMIKNSIGGYDFWKEYDPISKEVHVMVKPEWQGNFQKLLTTFNIKFDVMIENVQKLIDEETSTDYNTDDNSFGWTRYYELHEIQQWLDGILATYPSVTQAFTIGKSYEGRDIRGIKISYKSGNPGIFIESNIHAREWITSATATWFINQLLTSQDAKVRDLAENHDWYIIPVFNVDGFVYSHEKNRMWRKTRQPVANNDCIGTDANRNFDSHWMANGGASDNPCSETFAGPKAFSEPEVDALVKYFAGIKDKINIYLSFHSYGQYLLSPYGHTKEEVPPNYDHLYAISEEFASAIKSLSYGTEYTYGSTAIALYVASGSSVDYFFNEQGIRVGFTIEYRDKGRYGFVLPPVQILPNCEELMAGMLALVAKSKEFGYLS